MMTLSKKHKFSDSTLNRTREFTCSIERLSDVDARVGP